MNKITFALFLALTGVAVAADPLPMGQRQRIVLEFEDRFSQMIGTPVHVLSDHMYTGGLDCVVARIQGKKYKIVIPAGEGTPIPNASVKQWADAGCLQPGYQLLR